MIDLLACTELKTMKFLSCKQLIIWRHEMHAREYLRAACNDLHYGRLDSQPNIHIKQ